MKVIGVVILLATVVLMMRSEAKMISPLGAIQWHSSAS